MNELSQKLINYFPGKIVRKDLTKKIKEGANVPVYVLEYLLGMYCASTDEQVVEEGVANVKKILADNFVRPDEAQKIISKLREKGSHTVIDKISAKLDFKNDQYVADFSNLGINYVPISDRYVSKYERLLCGGIWCIVNMDYFYDENDRRESPFIIHKLTPIQMPGLDLEEVKNGREHFSKEEWIDVLLRSVGMEPSHFTERVKWLHLARIMPLIENNINLCELGPRGTGKSHIYREILPNSILVSGGQTTVANLFYNMSSKTVGLVGMWDCVAFDEEFVPVPEQGGGKLIPEGLNKSGHVYTIARGKSGMLGTYKIETEVVSGTGKYICTGIGSTREARGAADTAYRYLKANSKSINGMISTTTKDFMLHVQDLNGVGITNSLSLVSLVALCSAALNKPAIPSLAVLGNLSIGGTITKVEELANVLQVCLDSGAKKVLIPILSAVDMGRVPPELMGNFNIIFYQSPEDAVFKALGVD